MHHFRFRNIIRTSFHTLIVLAAVMLPLAPALAQAQSGCFPNVPSITNCVTGRFLTFWQQNGGLALYGYPITATEQQADQTTGQFYDAQWFERNRFEDHPEHAAPYDVQLGRLGVDLLAARGIDWHTLPQAMPKDAHYFAETGHAVSNATFWQYWSSHGLSDSHLNSFQRSLALFGFPISEASMEQSANGEMVLTQWFERARFEYHPTAGVLLGLLGSEMRAITSQAGAVQLTQADNGKSIALTLNQTLIVVLQSDRSTGYSWQITETSQGMLRQQSEPEYRAGTGAPGDPNTTTFRFTTVGTGETPLTFTFQQSARSATPPQPEYTFTVHVTVR